MVDLRNLSRLVYGNGFTIWHYQTIDSMQVVLHEGYFNSAAGMLSEGDKIEVSSAYHGFSLFVRGVLEPDFVWVQYWG